MIPLFITAILSGRQPVIYGDGLQSRDFTFVANVVHGNLLAADAPGVAGRALNVANGRTTNLWSCSPAEPAAWVRRSAAARAARVGDVRESMADITLARSDLGYEPQIGLRGGTARSIDYYEG